MLKWAESSRVPLGATRGLSKNAGLDWQNENISDYMRREMRDDETNILS